MKFLAFKKKYIDVKLILLLAGFYTLFNLVYILKLAYIRAYASKEVLTPWSDIIFHNLIYDWFIVVIYMSLIAVSTKRLLNKRYSWYKIFLLHTLFSILIGFVIRFVFDVQGILFGRMKFSEYSFKASIDRMMYVIELNFLIYFAMIFIIYTYYYLKQVKEAEIQRSQLESQLSNTRMKMLSSQLQPHFLFNTLNSISALVDIDTKKAQNTIADLSDLLREILYSSENYKVSLSKEIRMLDYYLNILNLRFSDHLKLKKHIDSKLLDRLVPALILQPLIENSVKHGYSYRHTTLVINISILKKNKFLILKVANDGKHLPQEKLNIFEKGVGLKNIRDRLFTLYGEKAKIIIRNRKEKGVETIIKIPISQTH